MPVPGDDAPTDPAVVGNSGAARHRIPIEVPPGPGGFAPKIELVYSSRTGDGLLGVGWNLTIPEIRCSGRFGAPDLASCEHFELDDQPLVHASGNRYHTFVESFQKIERIDANEWRVARPDGTKLYFGGALAYQVVQGGATARFLLRRMEDAFGNPIFFAYDSKGDVGSAYPSAITYGAGATAASGPRQIVFDYNPRPDPRIVFNGGLRREINHRLQDIQVFGHGLLARRYYLEYEVPGQYDTDRSRLKSVQEFGSDCTAEEVAECEPPRVFRRLHDLRRWSEGKPEHVFAGLRERGCRCPSRPRSEYASRRKAARSIARASKRGGSVRRRAAS